MKRVLIVGSGQRVREAALPVFMAAREEFEIAGIYSRKPKRITAAGREFEVAGLDRLDAAALAAADVIYMVVAKDAVPAVLRGIVRHDVSGLDMLIDTPVFRFRLMGNLPLLAPFRNTWVTEDCTTLPFLETLEAFRSTRAVQAPERVLLDRSGYAYHGVALGRALLGGDRVSGGRRVQERGHGRRTVSFGPARELVVIEPRDYSLGHITIEAPGGVISDDPAADAEHRLAALIEDGACIGFSIGGTRTLLSPDERALMGTPLAGDGVTVWMEGMKRVGFLRLLQSVAAGRGAHSLDHAVEDTLVDYYLEKFGRYISTPVTSPYSPLTRFGLRLLTRVTGG